MKLKGNAIFIVLGLLLALQGSYVSTVEAQQGTRPSDNLSRIYL